MRSDQNALLQPACGSTTQQLFWLTWDASLYPSEQSLDSALNNVLRW